MTTTTITMTIPAAPAEELSPVADGSRIPKWIKTFSTLTFSEEFDRLLPTA
jgi:hypothetical protein